MLGIGTKAGRADIIMYQVRDDGSMMEVERKF